jgi:ATP-binding cassette subfamily B protein
VLIDGSQSFYCKRFRDADLTLRRAQASNAFIGASPRYAIEALGLVLIAGLAYQLAGEAGGVTSAIPVLGALALGAQRLLPQLQQAYSAWSSIRGSQAALSDALVLLEQPLPSQLGGGRSLQLPFETGIRLKKLGFRYGESGQFVFRDIDLTIHKGSRVGFVGSTGCGKSTLLDVVMGLLEPTEGVIEIDERILTVKESPSWRARIAHVPQSIFLADASVTENIAFGVPSECIDAVRVAWAAEQAQISATIEAWPMRYKTHVGERGIRLSGGQRQRIGIARALYKQCDVIVFDEATSALDSETERAVMRSISALGKELTLLVIAHRVGTLSNCDRIVEVGEDGLIQVCTYAEFISDK